MKETFKVLKTLCIQINISQNYEPGDFIGEGAFSVVFLAYSLSDSKKYAIKSISKPFISSSVDGLVN